MWIGLLYYFNFVQVDALKNAAADTPPTGAGITKHVAPRALLFFRWAAVVTVLAGLMILGDKRRRRAVLQGARLHPDRRGRVAGPHHVLQRLGADLAQPEEDPGHRAGDRRGEEQGAPRRRSSPRALNTALSIPMLFFMVASGGIFRRAFFG